MEELHEYQFSILRTLLFKPGARFSELNKVGISSDHFNFHVKQLSNWGLIKKENQKYFLTNKGKELAGRMDTEQLTIEKQAKLGVALHAVRKNKGVTEYLIHHRLKEPLYGWYGSHSGKIRRGEKPEETAKREFFEETGLTGKFSLKAIKQQREFDATGKLLEDKYFWVYRVDDVQGTLKEKVEEGENLWMTKKEIKKLKNVFASFEEMYEVLESQEVLILRGDRTLEKY